MPLSCASPEVLDDAPLVDEPVLPDAPAFGLVLLLVPVLGDVLPEVEPLVEPGVLGAELTLLPLVPEPDFGVLVAELGV
jgi:hypothetical protein